MGKYDNWHEPNPDDLEDIRVRRESPSAGIRDVFVQLQAKLCNELLAGLDPTINVADKVQLRRYVHDRVDAMLAERNLVLNRSEKRQLTEAIVEEISGSQK